MHLSDFDTKLMSSSSSGGLGDRTRKRATGGGGGMSQEMSSSSELSGLPPAHQIHNRMMGWKLTSPERRKELLSMLANAQLSASTVEDEGGTDDVFAAIAGRATGPAANGVGGDGMDEARRVARRQAEALEASIG